MTFMSTDKPKIIFAMEEDLLKRIDDYRFENRINSRSEAIRRLIEEGLKKCSAEHPQKKTNHE
jgi:metal-responsive CopG/Arc/MetJ family transcriptional regulator